jgi:hypothetical protein
MAEPEFHGLEESDVITRGRGGVFGVPLRTPRAGETKRLEKCFMTGASQYQPGPFLPSHAIPSHADITSLFLSDLTSLRSLLLALLSKTTPTRLF